MILAALLVLAAAPAVSPLKGLDKPKKEQRGTLGDSENTKGKVKIHCVDVGSAMLVEIDDPGLVGARDVWLRKKVGDAMPPCDANESDVRHVTGVPGFGYVAGTKGDFLFATSADAFGDRMGLRVFALSTGEQVYEAEFSLQQPVTLTMEGKSLLMRFHLAVSATCEPRGEEAAACWKEVREAARVPEKLEVKAPPCDEVFRGKNALPGTALLALPVEVDLAASPRKPRHLPGAATCAESP
ncbi:MAG: hypothetical protein ACOZQL_22940 [Myxococcota bacterium]